MLVVVFGTHVGWHTLFRIAFCLSLSSIGSNDVCLRFVLLLWLPTQFLSPVCWDERLCRQMLYQKSNPIVIRTSQPVIRFISNIISHSDTIFAGLMCVFVSVLTKCICYLLFGNEYNELECKAHLPPSYRMVCIWNKS